MKRLVLAFVALALLATASYLTRGGLSSALAFALAKACIVLVVFMEIGRASATSRAAVAVAFALALLLVGFAAADVATRDTTVSVP